MEPLAGKVGGTSFCGSRQKFRCAEVEQPRRAIFRNQNVIGLKVAMNNQVLVGKLHCLANLEEQGKPLLHAESLFLAEGVNGHAIHILHRYVQIAFRGDAAIEKARNIRMLKAGENLALLTKAFAEEIGGERQVYKLNGDLLFELAVGTVRQINRPHAAAPHQPINLVRAGPFLFQWRMPGSLFWRARSHCISSAANALTREFTSSIRAGSLSQRAATRKGRWLDSAASTSWKIASTRASVCFECFMKTRRAIYIPAYRLREISKK